jgi:hypothetical protein
MEECSVDMGAVAFFVPFYFVAMAMSKGIGLAFAGICEEEVRKKGGLVLRTEVRMWAIGPFPFWFRDSNRTVAKVIYRDRNGEVQQLWGQRKGWFRREHEYNWVYSDGDNRYEHLSLWRGLARFFFT